MAYNMSKRSEAKFRKLRDISACARYSNCGAFPHFAHYFPPTCCQIYSPFAENFRVRIEGDVFRLSVRSSVACLRRTLPQKVVDFGINVLYAIYGTNMFFLLLHFYHLVMNKVAHNWWCSFVSKTAR